MSQGETLGSSFINNLPQVNNERENDTFQPTGSFNSNTQEEKE